MKTYQAVPYRLYPGEGDEMMHFNEDSLEFTALSPAHCSILAEFASRQTKESVLQRHIGDQGAASLIDEIIEFGLVKKTILVHPIQKEVNLRPEVQAFRIVLTEKCNIRCAECFVTKKAGRLRNMSLETLEEVIRKTIPYGTRENLRYHFFGGEPLLRFGHIRRAVEILEEAVVGGHMKQPQYATTTNATLITDKIIAFFKKFDFKVGVSIDGLEDVNDRLRIYADGRGTFKTVARNYDRLLEAGINCHVLITPHPRFLDELPSIFRGILKRFPMKAVTVNTPFHFETVQWSVPGKRYATVLVELMHIAKEFGVSVDSAITPSFAAIANNLRREGPCAFQSAAIVASINPEGQMSFCPQKWQASLVSLSTSDTGLCIPIRRAENCLSCEARNICGGPCPAFQHLSGQTLDKNKCDFMRALIGEVAGNIDLFEVSE